MGCSPFAEPRSTEATIIVNSLHLQELHPTRSRLNLCAGSLSDQCPCLIRLSSFSQNSKRFGFYGAVEVKHTLMVITKGVCTQCELCLPLCGEWDAFGLPKASHKACLMAWLKRFTA